MGRRRGLRLILVVVSACIGLFVVFKLAGWGYANWQVRRAIAQGVYPTAEEAMHHLIAENYRDVRRAEILYAGPNELDGSSPHVWYVVAEVHAARYADGSEVGHNGCDAPGTFIFQTQRGWFEAPEGLLTFFLGQWMEEYGLAGAGQATASIDTFQGHPAKMCQ
jgi:hypothetical protein